MRASIVDYRMGNLASVSKALEVSGFQTTVSDDAAELAKGDLLVMPGVGNFTAGASNLKKVGLWSFVQSWAAEDKPLLGICLGMQLLFEHSDEGDSEGLQILPGKVVRISSDVKVPHMGWNQIHAGDSSIFKGFSGKSFYFVHSYVCNADRQTTAATTEYGQEFAAAVQKGNICGVQFHPEKSSADGLALLRRIKEVFV